MATESRGDGNDPLGLSGLLARMNFLPRGNYPAVSNAGMFPLPRSPYNSMDDQIFDAFQLQRVMGNQPINRFSGYKAARYGFGNPSAGGGGPGGSGGNPVAPPGTVYGNTGHGTGLWSSGSGYNTGTNPMFPMTGIMSPGNAEGGPMNPSSPGTGLFPVPIGTSFQPPGPIGPKAGDPLSKSGLLADGAGGFDPGSGNTSVASMLAHFNSLGDDAAKANYLRAIDQYSLGKGGAPMLGAAMQAALRQQMGGANFDAWSGTNLGAKPGVISRDGLPPWLVAELGG